MASDTPSRVTLGKTGIEVSPLILATWSFAGRKGPFGERLPARDVERAFHELDTNALFATPKMKELAEGVRRLIRAGHRDEMVLVSLAGIPTAGRVLAYWNRCSRSFGIEMIDVFLMGWVQRSWYLRHSVWHAMNLLKESGRVRAIGFSIHDRRLAARLVQELDPPPDVLMIRYNAAHRGAETDIFDHLPEEKPGVMAYTTTRWGELLQARPEAGFPTGMTAPECYRFALAHPAVDAALCGARAWSELEEDVHGVREGPLSPERYEEIKRFGDAVHADPTVPGSRFMFRHG